RAYARLAHDLGPFGNLFADQLREFSGGAGDDFESHVRHALFRLGQFHDAYDFSVKLLHDGARRAGGREQAVPRVGGKPRKTLLRNRPERTCGVTAVMPMITIGICPASTSITACPPPLYGTCVICTFARRLSNSPDMCPMLPIAEVPHAIAPGFTRASAISSCRFFAGTPG